MCPSKNDLLRERLTLGWTRLYFHTNVLMYGSDGRVFAVMYVGLGHKSLSYKIMWDCLH